MTTRTSKTSSPGGDELADEPRDVGATQRRGSAAFPVPVSISTPPWRRRSSGRPAATTRPWSTITTWSQTSSTSESRCELSRTEVPRARSSSSSARDDAPARRDRARSSARRAAGAAASRQAPARCRAAAACPSTSRRLASSCVPRGRRARAARRARRRRPREPARRWWSVEQLVGAHPAREAEQLGEIPERAAGGERARRRPAHLDLPAARADEAAGDLDERRLAGAVRAEQPDELALSDLDVDARQRLDLPVALVERPGGERSRHRRARYPVLLLI